MSTAKTPKTLDVNQQRQLLEAIQRLGAPRKTAMKGVRNYLMACLMLDAGLRVGEVVQLKISHLYFNSVPVNTLVLTADITKNHKERTVPVNTRLAESLRSFFSTFLLMDLNSDSALVFCHADKVTPITTRQVENIFSRAGMKAFGHRVNPHKLRHTFASSLLRVTNMRTVQVLLGHNFITSTQIYTHPNEDDKVKAIEDLQQEATGPDKDVETSVGGPSVIPRPET